MLPALFREVQIPPAVHAEFVRIAQNHSRFHGLVLPVWVRIAAGVAVPSNLANYPDLDIGEIEALALALGIQADAVLLDETSARKAALHLQIPYIGPCCSGSGNALTTAALGTKYVHMKTVTVRDLRNNFSKLEAWLGEGEQIQIEKRGQPIALLTGLRTERIKARRVDFAAPRRKIWGNRIFTDAEVTAMRSAEVDDEEG